MKKILFFSLLLSTAVLRAQNTDTTITDAQKIYGLSRFWQEANYNFAYFENVPNLNWDSVYQSFIPRVIATKSNYAYYRELQRFCALLKDGHTNVFFPDYISSKIARRSFGDIKLELRNIDGKAIVVNTAAASKQIVPVGSEITEVNSIPVKKYIDQYIRPFIAQSANYIVEDYCVDFLLEGFLGDTIRITYQKPDKSIQSILLKREVKDIAWLQAYTNSIFEFKWLPGDIAKIDLNTFGSEKIVDTFITVLPELRKAKGVIIDLRKNGGGSSNNASEILSYFTDKDSIKGSKWLTRQHLAAYRAWGTYANWDKDSSAWAKKTIPHFKGTAWYEGGQMVSLNTVPKEQRMPTVPLVVMLGHQTASAAEDFLIMLDDLKGRATTIGQKSFASTGQPLPFALPGGGSARICTKKDTYPDGRVFVGKGIVPAIEINPTLNDYLQNKDVALEKAVDILTAKKK